MDLNLTIITNMSNTMKLMSVFFVLFIILFSYCLFNRKTLLKLQNNKEDISNNEFFNNMQKVRVNMYYVDWCPHCVSTKPEFNKFMQKYNNENINGKLVKINMINCTDDSSEAEKEGVTGYPTIRYTVNGIDSDFNGERSEKGFLNYLKHLLST